MSLARQYVIALVRVLCSLDDDDESGHCLSHESKSFNFGAASSVLKHVPFFILAFLRMFAF